MFRMWGKIFKDNRLVSDTVSCISDYSLTRTQMVFQALTEICCRLDLGEPIWLDANIRAFQLHAKPASARIILSNRSILIFWRSRS